MIKNILFIAIGGAFGSVIRYLFSYFYAKASTCFPWATFCVNTIGSLLIGCLFAIFSKNISVNESLKLLTITGFCGGFTTFSALSLENLQFIQNQQYKLALIYTFSSLIFGLIAVLLGYKIFNS